MFCVSKNILYLNFLDNRELLNYNLLQNNTYI